MEDRRKLATRRVADMPDFRATFAEWRKSERRQRIYTESGSQRPLLGSYAIGIAVFGMPI